jgi:hypothetical protein
MSAERDRDLLAKELLRVLSPEPEPVQDRDLLVKELLRARSKLTGSKDGLGHLYGDLSIPRINQFLKYFFDVFKHKFRHIQDSSCHDENFKDSIAYHDDWIDLYGLVVEFANSRDRFYIKLTDPNTKTGSLFFLYELLKILGNENMTGLIKMSCINNLETLFITFLGE